MSETEFPQELNLPPLKVKNPRDNLIPMNKRTKEEASALSRKGGLSRSPSKKLAAQLRRMRERGATKEEALKIYEIMTDPEMSALDILKYIQQVRAHAEDPRDEQTTAKLMMDWHKIQHGTKEKSDTNLNLNVSGNDTVNFKFELPKEFKAAEDGAQPMIEPPEVLITANESQISTSEKPVSAEKKVNSETI